MNCLLHPLNCVCASFFLLYFFLFFISCIVAPMVGAFFVFFHRPFFCIPKLERVFYTTFFSIYRDLFVFSSSDIQNVNGIMDFQRISQINTFFLYDELMNMRFLFTIQTVSETKIIFFTKAQNQMFLFFFKVKHIDEFHWFSLYVHRYVSLKKWFWSYALVDFIFLFHLLYVLWMKTLYSFSVIQINFEILLFSLAI